MALYYVSYPKRYFDNWALYWYWNKLKEQLKKSIYKNLKRLKSRLHSTRNMKSYPGDDKATQKLIKLGKERLSEYQDSKKSLRLEFNRFLFIQNEMINAKLWHQYSIRFRTIVLFSSKLSFYS